MIATEMTDAEVLEARLLVSHPDLDWLDGIRAFKAERYLDRASSGGVPKPG